MKPLVSFEQFRSFIDQQLKPHGGGPEQRPRKPFVTISRQAGAGGTTVSEHLVAWLDKHAPLGTWTIFDKALAEKVAEDGAMPKRIARYVPESTRNFIESTVEELLGLHPPIESLVEQTARTMLNLAEMGNVVIVGRAANLVTAKVEHGFHVRLVGSAIKRTIHLANLNGLTVLEAGHMLKMLDQSRSAYVKKYYHTDVEDPMHYHLVLNTDLISYEDAAEIIGREVLKRIPAASKPRLPFLEMAKEG